MIAYLRNSWIRLFKGREAHVEKDVDVIESPIRDEVITIEIDFDPDDPILDYLSNQKSVVEVDKVLIESKVDSKGLRELKSAGVKILVPLVSQGELIGILNLGPRLSEQEYSRDDQKLLLDLATQAAPALRLAQLARQQQAEARHRERLEQELRVARIIQQTLLPKDLPQPDGWQIAAHWQPAREVSGDFYDFIDFPDGKLGVIVGDVTDKGVPASLVMATTRGILRTASEHYNSPGEILAYVNDQLVPNIPANMFVTCLYLILDPSNGQMVIANAGHNLPMIREIDRIGEERVTGMPLGLMPGMEYEEKVSELKPGSSILIYSDGLVEAHNPQEEMFGFPRLNQALSCLSDESDCPDGEELINYLLEQLSSFTGPEWVQEDDVTFVVLDRFSRNENSYGSSVVEGNKLESFLQNSDCSWELLTEFSLPSEQGNEMEAVANVEKALQEVIIASDRLKRLKTAVAEATMNAMEHGNLYDESKTVDISVLSSHELLVVRISDHGGEREIPEPEAPDIQAKLDGLQSPRGWGLFLIQNMVDEMKVISDEEHHTVELYFNITGDQA